MKHIVIGAGEVGTAVHAVLSRTHETVLRDIDPVDDTADVLDVCIPWQADFVDQVQRYADHHQADLVVVHSTVPVGTCDANGWVHSPVRGRHPNLADGVATFRKHFGGARSLEAVVDWIDADVPVLAHPRGADTEAGKLWELVQYGLQIRVEKAIHAWCEKHDVDPEIAYRGMAQSYNEGYEQLGEHQFVRPVLDHVPGPIGGHCVVPMARLLDHPLAEFVADGAYE